jgi:hypothetical protein
LKNLFRKPIAGCDPITRAGAFGVEKSEVFRRFRASEVSGARAIEKRTLFNWIKIGSQLRMVETDSELARGERPDRVPQRLL